MSDLASAQIVIPHIMELIQPRSVLHVGCGRGVWLSVFRECGAEDVWGIDEDPPHASDLLIDADRVLTYDGESAFTLNREFDLVIYIDRGEHVAQRDAAPLVKSLTGLSPVVLFSAAAPYQDGILAPAPNEQWPQFWWAHFRDRGFEAVDVLRPRLWCNEYVNWRYAQNALLFIRRQALANYSLLCSKTDSEASSPRSYIHPKPYLALIQRFQAEYKRQAEEIERLQRSCEESETRARVVEA